MNNKVIIAVVTVVFLAISIYALIKLVTTTIKERKKQLAELLKDNECETVAIGAKVISKFTYIDYHGIKMPEHNIVYKVAFLTDNGDNVEFVVDKTIFDNVSEYDTGTLVTVNGDFFDFGKGEIVE